MKTSLSPPGTGHRLHWAIAAGLLASGCGGNGNPSSGSASSGQSLTPAAYYNLVPGLCAEYSNDAGGTGPTIGVQIRTSASPPGIELFRTRHGVMDEEDFLSFAADGGGVFLQEREYVGAMGTTEEVYSTPLSYLPAPPLSLNETIMSSSTCPMGSACTTMNLNVSVASQNPYTGVYGHVDGGLTESHMFFLYEYNNDGGAEETVLSSIVPGIGFTDLFLPSDEPSGNYTHYLLVDIIPDDAGVCAQH